MTAGGYGAGHGIPGIPALYGQALDQPVVVSNCEARHVAAPSMRWKRGAPWACSRIAKQRPDEAKDARIRKSTPPTVVVSTETWRWPAGALVAALTYWTAASSPASAAGVATAPSLVSIAFAAVRLLRSRFWACRSWAGRRACRSVGIMMPIRMPTIPMTTMSSIMVNPVSSSRRCIASPVRDASGPGTKVPGPPAHVTEVDRRLPGLGPAATGGGVGGRRCRRRQCRRRRRVAAGRAEVREHRARTVGRVTDREAVPRGRLRHHDDRGRRTDVHRNRLRGRGGSRLERQAGLRGGEAGHERTAGRAVGVLVGVDALGVGECVAEARLSRLVLRTGLGAEEGRDGDRDQNGNDQHHDHELDERETTLVVLTPSPQVRKHVLHCDVPPSGSSERDPVSRSADCFDTPGGELKPRDTVDR